MEKQDILGVVKKKIRENNKKMNKEWIFKWNRVENRESDVSVLKNGKLICHWSISIGEFIGETQSIAQTLPKF